LVNGLRKNVGLENQKKGEMMVFAAAAESWSTYLRKLKGKKAPQMSEILDSRFDWARIINLAPQIGLEISITAPSGEANAIRDNTHSADQMQHVERRKRRINAAIASYAANAHGSALAAITAALEYDIRRLPETERNDPKPYFLRGAIRLGTPETDEPTLINPKGAWHDFAAAARCAESQNDHTAAAICHFAAGWAAFCAGSFADSIAHAEKALHNETCSPIAAYLLAKAGAASCAPDVVATGLQTAIKLDPQFAARAVEDGDFARVRRTLEEVFNKINDSASVGHAALEAARLPVIDAMRGIAFAAVDYQAPEEFFQQTPFPNRNAPLSLRLASLRLSRQALSLALHEISSAVAQEKPVLENKITGYISDLGVKRAHSRRIGLAGGVFLAFAFAAIAGLAMHHHGLTFRFDIAPFFIGLGSLTLIATTGGAALWRVALSVTGAQKIADARSAAEGKSTSLGTLALVVESAQHRLEQIAATPELAVVWPDAKPGTDNGIYTGVTDKTEDYLLDNQTDLVTFPEFDAAEAAAEAAVAAAEKTIELQTQAA
jgi:hypothetical protein